MSKKIHLVHSDEYAKDASKVTYVPSSRSFE